MSDVAVVGGGIVGLATVFQLLRLQPALRFPELQADQLVFGPSGVRAQAVSNDGAMVDDFAIAGAGNVLHVINAPSPAATASLAIGRVLAEKAAARFSAA